MKNKGLTLSVIFEAESANYGEGFGNIATLKKLSRGDGNSYTYISRQALRYNIVQQLGWNDTEVQSEGKSGVVQFAPLATIKDYPEIDLFGYMKTSKEEKAKGGALTRNAVARLSNAIALEPYCADMDFLTNMGLAKRKDLDNNISQSEIHKSYYAYTLTIDLDKVGIDANDKLEIPSAQKAERVVRLLDALKTLYRDIRGRRENLSPLFVVGGVYDIKNPFFENRLKVTKNKLDVELIKDAISMAGYAEVGCVKGIFSNGDEIETLKPIGIAEFFDKLSTCVLDYYG